MKKWLRSGKFFSRFHLFVVVGVCFLFEWKCSVKSFCWNLQSFDALLPSFLVSRFLNERIDCNLFVCLMCFFNILWELAAHDCIDGFFVCVGSGELCAFSVALCQWFLTHFVCDVHA